MSGTNVQVNVSLRDLEAMIDVYECWLWGKALQDVQDPPFGWDLNYYEALCEHLIATARDSKE